MICNVHYSYSIVSTTDLFEIIHRINKRQDKIIAVTQHGNTYTIFYEDCGNVGDDE